MELIFSAIAAVCAALALVVSLLVLKNQKSAHPPAQNADAARIEQMFDRANYIAEQSAHANRDYLDFMAKQQSGNLKGIAEKLETLNASTERRLSEIQRVVAGEIKYMTEQNAHNLEQIRQTVDEKLSSTLENRLNKSYSIINERLEAVYKGIGEVAQLAGSVADIKKVFTNVKLRGTWGEVQLSALLEQMLSPAQYRANVHIDPLSNDVVEYAILLPSGGETVYLPVDSKFPVEEFERLTAASERGDKEGEERARKNLERAVKLQADSIAKKYIHPPVTTDFGVMYLPSEGLYAEVVRTPGLSDWLRAHRVLAVGPTNFGALLSTLQTGFRTAAIEKRSGELRDMLDSFRADFAKFAELLEKTRRKLQEAQDTVESAEKRTGTIGRKLESFRGLGGALPPADDES